MTTSSGREPHNGPVDPAYPGAKYRYWDDVPATCPRDGGPWRRVRDGVACLTCPEQAAVVQAIRAAQGTDRWIERPDEIVWRKKPGPRTP